MAENKTKQTEVDPNAFIDTVPDPKRREDAREVMAMMERLSGHKAAMWGPTIIGFGRYSYKYDSGHKGEMARIGFSPNGGMPSRCGTRVGGRLEGVGRRHYIRVVAVRAIPFPPVQSDHGGVTTVPPARTRSRLSRSDINRQRLLDVHRLA